MSIEEQIRSIAKEELEAQLAEAEKRLKAARSKETKAVRDQIEALGGRFDEIDVKFEELYSRLGKLEEELSNRWGLLVKLRKYTLDQLMSEYKRLTGSLRPEQEESVENAEI